MNKTLESKKWTRIEDYKSVVLCRGTGQTPESGLCVMQTVAWFAGERLTDHPECASPVLTNFSIVVNDGLEDAPRQQLRKLVVALSGSRADDKEVQRVEFLIVRVATSLLAPTLRASGRAADRLALASSCDELVKDMNALFGPPYPGTPAAPMGIHSRRSRITSPGRQVLKAAERFIAARDGGGNPVDISGALVDAALAGVLLNPQGDKLVEIIEQAIRIGVLREPAASGKPPAGMTGKDQAARCSAKGTPPCPSLSSPALIPALVCAGYASSTGLAA